MELLNPNTATPDIATQQATAAPAAGGANDLDIRAMLGRAIRQWYLFILFPLITFTLAYLYLRYEVPEYEVKGIILIKESAEDRAMARAVSLNNNPLSSTESNVSLTNQIEILGSYSLLRAVVDSLDLDVKYIAEGRVRSTNLYEIEDRPFLIADYRSYNDKIYGKSFFIDLNDDGQTFTLTYGEEPTKVEGELGRFITLPFGQLLVVANPEANSGRTSATVTVSDPVSLARKYGSKLNISTVGGSELLELSMIDEVPERAIDIINQVIEEYNRLTILEKTEVATRTTSFVNDRLDYLTDELNEVEAAAEDYVINNEIIGGTQRELERIFAQIAANEKQAIEIELNLDAIDRVQEVVRSGTSDSLSYLPYGITLENLNLSQLISEYNLALANRETLLQSAKSNNPVLLPLNEQISQIRALILQVLKQARQDLLEASEELAESNQQLYQSVRTIPGKERGLLAIERQQNIREQLYLFLLQQREETALSSAASVSNVRVFEAPMRRGSTSTGSLPVYGIALLIGLIVPAGLIAAQEILDNTITKPEQIKALTSTPFLGTIAHERNDERIVVTPTSRTPIAEMFRMLRTNLQFMGAGKRQQAILVTSSMGGEGKTFVCINLGMSLAISGKRVVMLGMDFRKPKLGKYLTQDDDYAGVGITNYLTGNVTLNDVISQSQQHENLYYISSGAIPPNPAELLMLPKVSEMIDTLRQEFDYIIIDMPPVGLVTDALLMADRVDAAAYVARFGETKKEQLKIVDEIYRTHKLPNVAVVLNGVKQGRGYGYSYGYGYGYGYGYYDAE